MPTPEIYRYDGENPPVQVGGMSGLLPAFDPISLADFLALPVEEQESGSFLVTGMPALMNAYAVNYKDGVTTGQKLDQISSAISGLSYREPDETFTATSSTKYSDVAKWLATKRSNFTPFTVIQVSNSVHGGVVLRWTGQQNWFLSEWVAYNGLKYGLAFTYVSDSYASAWQMTAGNAWANISTTACSSLVLKLWY